MNYVDMLNYQFSIPSGSYAEMVWVAQNNPPAGLEVAVFRRKPLDPLPMQFAVGFTQTKILEETLSLALGMGMTIEVIGYSVHNLPWDLIYRANISNVLHN